MTPTATRRGLAPVRRVLDNGAVVIAKSSPATPAVTINASLHAGSAFDPPGREGLAHFVSRTIDRGTQTRPADRLAEELDGHGVSLTITVNRQAISLVCTCLVEHLEPILDLLADIVMHPTFSPEEVETRRGEIVTMIRQDEDNPAIVAIEGLLAALYGAHHPFGRRPRGSAETVAAVDRDALQALHRDRFRPASLSLVLVGDVEPARAIACGAAAFEKWRAAPAAPLALAPVEPRTARLVRVAPMMSKAQADIAYGFTTVRRADPDYYAFWMMNNILGQYSIGGRLGDSIRERQGMAYYAFSSLDANVIAGPLIIRAGVSPANVERAVASIDQELSRLAADGPSETEVRESRQYLIGSLPRTLETNAGIATFLQTEEFFGLGLDYDLRVPELLGAVTREAIHDAAHRTLDPARAAVMVAGPYAGQLR